ncbi:3-deoxy-manno-octulosonate cytidylyltransferase [Flavobacteriales bacterium]|nr:3-deoxy-manno-octulosonate cytidylyltransferase [Flavobacteriales bacterium]
MITIAVIPARMCSSRFPGKPMVDILGMPMIGHCYKRAEMSELIDFVYVATCDKEIYDYIISIGGNVVMTSDLHERACDRAAEAMIKIEKIHNVTTDILLMMQGDEPMVTPKIIEAALKPLITSKDIQISNLYRELNSIEEFNDPNEVKVVIDKNGYAIYFSREPIPSRKKGVSKVPMLKQICTIPFRRDFLLKFNEMSQTELEIIESIDMNRIIENGEKIKMEYSEDESISVDTLSDLDRVVIEMKDDAILNKTKYNKI